MIRRALSTLLLLLAAACSVTGERPLDAPADPALIWELHGRVAVSDGAERWSGSLYWRVERDAFRLELAGPLGQGAVRLEEDRDGARLTLSDGEVYEAERAETLLARHFGWSLPVSGLRHWAVGEADPARPFRVRTDDAGRTEELVQDGWRLHFDRYRPIGGGVRWPHRLRAERDDFRLRLVVDQWRRGPASA